MRTCLSLGLTALHRALDLGKAATGDDDDNVNAKHAASVVTDDDAGHTQRGHSSPSSEHIECLLSLSPRHRRARCVLAVYLPRQHIQECVQVRQRRFAAAAD